MTFWSDVVQQTQLNISTGAKVETIDVTGSGFEVRADKCYRTANVLLAIGRRGSPRKLGVPGEEYSKVVYHLVDPQQYRGKKVVVVGGGDSAMEAAISLSEEPGTEVVLSYRGDVFNRVKSKNRERLAAAVAAGQLRVELSSQLQQITPDSIVMEATNGIVQLDNDAVIICAGGILPTGFLKSVGIAVETRYGTV